MYIVPANTAIPFLRFRMAGLVFSVILVLGSIGSFLGMGLNTGIDFRGGILLEAVRKIAPDSKTAKILIQRDEETALPKLFYSKLPADVRETPAK